MKNRSFVNLLLTLLIVSSPTTILAQGKSQENKKVKIEVNETAETKPGSKPSFVGEKNKVEVKEQGNKTVIKTEDRFGRETETELEPEEAEDVEITVTEATDEAKIKTKFKVNKNADGGFSVTESKFAAKTNYPLSINSGTNELTITTKKGSKVVTILPDAAIANMLRRGVLDTVDATDSANPKPGGDATASATPIATDDDSTESGEASDSGDVNELVDDAPIILTANDAGNPIYLVEGKKNKKFLGLFSVGIDKKVTISAETGEVVDEEVVGLGDKILNALSI